MTWGAGTFHAAGYVHGVAPDVVNKLILTDYTCKCMDEVYEGWWAFAWKLVGTNYDGMHINEDGSSTNRGYDHEYLEAVNFGATSLEDKAALGIN